MDQSIIKFQNTLFVTDDEKQTDIDTANVKLFRTPKELFDYYIFPIQQNLHNNSNLIKSYNEFTFNKKIKLFWDIDLKKEDYNNEDFLKYLKENKKKYNCANSELFMLKKLILDFINFLGKKKNIQFNYLEKENITTLDNEDFRKHKNYAIEILQNISITKSTNSEKYSFHVFFNNLIYLKEDSYLIKNFIKDFSLKCKNPLVKYIDLLPYKNKPLLRFIYSSKNNDDITYHKPILSEYNVNELEIEYDTVDLNENTVINYLYSYINNNKNNLEILIKEKIIESNELIIKEGTEPLEITDFSIPDIEFLTYKSILHRIFKEEDLAIFEQIGNLINLSFFDNKMVKDNKENEILLKFDYSKAHCIFCKKPSHKNPHRIFINNYGIVVIKKGISAKCIRKAYKLAALTERQICEWIFNKGIIKRLNNDELIVFSKLYGWQAIGISDYSVLKYIVKNYSNHFKNKDIITIENIKEITLKEHFKSISKIIPVTELSYHNYFKFKNGVLNIETNKFLPMEDSKDLIVLNGVDYNYKNEKDYNDEEKEKNEYLNLVIDQILPPVINNENNINRKIFEQNMSTCILTRPKDVITVFQGNTSAGKSTMKNLAFATLGPNNSVELPITTYTYPINPNKPNPWLGKINFKLVSFASEPGYKDKINSQTVKLMTEIEIQARLLNSNEQKQTNCLSQFIDTNPELLFDRDDAATLRRWAVVRFQTTFKSEKTQNLLSVFEKQSYNCSETLKQDIIERKYALIFFNILKNWCYKYNQFKNFSMQNTSEFAHYSLFLEFFTNCLVNSVLINGIHVIKEDAIDNYSVQTIKFRKEKKEYVTTNFEYISNKLDNVIKNKDWQIDLVSFLKKIEIKIKNKNLYTYIFLSDIREEYLEDVIKEYNIQNKSESKILITLDYYNENKELTNPIFNDKDE